MSNDVKIPISADASRAVSEMERFFSAIRKAGQEGRKFAELDFSHPEMSEFANDMTEAQRRFEEMVKVGRGETARDLRTGVRSGKYEDITGWFQNVHKQFPNSLLRERHMTNVFNGAFAGGPNQPTPPGGGDGGSGGGSGGGGLQGIIGGNIGSLLRWVLPLVGLAKAGSMAAEGISSAGEEATAVSSLRRSMGALSTDFDHFRNQVREAGEGLGVTYQQTVQLARAFTHASGQFEEKAAFRNTSEAISFARSMGMDPSQTVGRFGRAQWLGVGGKDTDALELAQFFSGAIAAGGMFTKADEVMDAITNWVATSESVMVDAPNAADYAALQAAMNASGRPGLQGTAGAAILNKIDAALRGGGGAGEAGQNFLFQTLSGVGVRDPFAVQKQLELGAFGKLKNGSTLLQSVMDSMKQQYTNPLMRQSAGGRLLGLSMHQYEALEKMKPVERNALAEAGKNHKFDPGKLDPTAMLDIAQIQGMGLDELKKRRDHILDRRDGELTDAQKKSLEGGNAESLREALISISAKLGMEKDIGFRTLDATVGIKNEVTRLADGLLTPITGMKEGVDKIFNLLNGTIEGDGLGQRGWQRKRDAGFLPSGPNYRAMIKHVPQYKKAYEALKKGSDPGYEPSMTELENWFQSQSGGHARRRTGPLVPGKIPQHYASAGRATEVTGSVTIDINIRNEQGKIIEQRQGSVKLRPPQATK